MTVAEKLKIAQLTSHISRNAGGVWEVIDNLSSALAENEMVNACIWGLRDNDTDQLTELSKVPCKAFKTIGPKPIGYATRLMQYVKQADIDLIHTHGAWMYPSYVSYSLARDASKPVIVSPHGMLDKWALKNSRWRKKLAGTLFESRHLKKAHCIHALTLNEAEAIRKYSASTPVCIIPNGITMPTEKRLKAEWISKLANNKNILLFLGRLAPQKGLDLLLDTLAKMQRRKSRFLKEWSVLIVGQGDEKYITRLKRFCSDNNLEKHVIFTGPFYDTAKKEVFSTSDAFILPSYSEGQPIAVLEAWSYKLPCVLSEHCNLEIGFKSGAALKTEMHIESLSEQLECLNDMGREQREYMGANGYTLVQQEFCWKKISHNMFEVYRWAVGRGQPPSSVEII